MFEYLVSSVARRSLLKLLHVELVCESVSSLAELAGVSFSTAYEELRAMENAGLAKSEYVGKRVFFRANETGSQSSLLKKLLKYESSGDNKDNVVLANLERMSASLGGKPKQFAKLCNEETLARAFKLARHNATVARVLPVALYKNANDLNFEKLKTLCFKQGEKKTLGFFLDLTSELASSKLFHDWALQLQDNRFRKVESFFVNPASGKHSKKLEAQNTPKVAKRWNFKMNMDFNNFKSHFDKFVHLEH